MKWKVVYLVSTYLILHGNTEEEFGNPERALLSHLLDSERIFLFGRDSDPEFQIAHVTKHQRHKRSIYPNQRQALQELISHLDLKQTPRYSILDPQFLLVKRWANHTQPFAKVHDEDLEDCFYRSANAALYTCDDLRGIIQSDDNHYYFIHPLPERFHSDKKKPHVIVKKSHKHKTDTKNAQVCIESDKINKRDSPPPVRTWTKHRRKRNTNDKDIDEIKHILDSNNNQVHEIVMNLVKPTNKRRKRAAASPAVFVETAVFIDRDLYKHMTINFPKDTERDLVRFVLAMVNAVQLLYHDPSLGRPVNFILKRLEILHEDPANLKRPHDIDRFLSNFCTWQRLENPPGDNDPLHWDHALILTGLDLYVVSKNGKVSSQVVGLAPVAGMCTVTSSCTVNEGRHFESVYVVAHEIGHNLGMRHDGPLADNGCDPTSYIMSPTLGSGKITWSHCSRNYLHKFLDTIQSRCLLDHGNSAGQLDHSAEGILPGERFDADQQCMLKYGRGSRHSTQQKLEDVCRDLHCQRERYTWTSHPALEGTKCGEDMYCRGGECQSRSGTPVSNGAWSSWSRWSECASACLLQGSLPAGIGVATADRRCSSRRHENGKSHCNGPYKKYQSCHAHQCDNVSRLTVREFADQICRRAREVDADLIGTGLQRIDSEDPRTACAVWCEARGGGYKSRGWSLPDGSLCSLTHNKYCINGLCQKFTCSSEADNEYSLKPSECMWNAPGDEDLRPQAVVTKHSSPWRREVSPPRRPPAPPAAGGAGSSACHRHCVWGARGLRLTNTARGPGIQLCTTSQHNAGCSQLKTPFQYATMVCTKYKERVRRLSGLGMQITPVADDPDRPCRIACQDERVTHRFYLVNGQEGWFPLGTPCGKRNSSYCVSGKCLEFGPDDTPVSTSTYSLPLLGRPVRRSSRHKRSLTKDPTIVQATLNEETIGKLIKNYNFTGNATEHVTYLVSIPDNIELDFSNPIHIAPEEALFSKVHTNSHGYTNGWDDGY